MGGSVFRPAFPKTAPGLGPALGLAWLLAGCSIDLPFVGGQSAWPKLLWDIDTPINSADHNLTDQTEEARRDEQLMRGVADNDFRSSPAIPTAIPGDLDNIRRFITLDRIFDAALITEQEYQDRRTANLGALLPLTQPPSELDADRNPPPAHDLVERLRIIAGFKQSGALDNDAYNHERDAVLNGLMPMPGDAFRAVAVVTPEISAPETYQRRLDYLLAAKLITPQEFDEERAVLVGFYASASGFNDDEDSLPRGERSMVDRPFAIMDREDPGDGAAEIQPRNPIVDGGAGNARAFDEPPTFAPAVNFAVGIDIHLALSRTPENARRRWDDLQRANGTVLDGLIPSISRVDLGEGKGIFFRLSAGPLTDTATAKALCNELHSRDFYCALPVF